MSRLYLITFICGFLLLGVDVSVADFLDDFEDGTINTSLWAVGGEKRGWNESQPPGIGAWNWSNQEIMGTDGYLQNRVWGPTSGLTYGAEAWVRTTKDFNDGKNHIINFTWEAIVGEPVHYDYYYIQITDGYIPYYGSVHWPSISRQNPVGTVNFLIDTDNGWSLTTGGISKTTWSMTITSGGIGKLYDGPNGGGSLIHQASLDDSKPWYLRFMLIDATSAGFPGGYNRLNLYDFSAVSEPTDIEAAIDIDPDTLNMNSKGKWITYYIELPDGYDTGDIDVGSILLENLLEVQHSDVQGDVLMVKFDRQDVIAYIELVLEIELPADVTLMVTGELNDGTPFEGSDTIRVINKGGKK